MHTDYNVGYYFSGLVAIALFEHIFACVILHVSPNPLDGIIAFTQGSNFISTIILAVLSMPNKLRTRIEGRDTLNQAQSTFHGFEWRSKPKDLGCYGPEGPSSHFPKLRKRTSCRM
jgi:hypothetical protein